MGYSTYEQRQKPRPWKIHPVWRGIGCLMLLIIPIMAWAGAILLIRMDLQQGWLRIPREMARTVALPFVGAIPNFWATVAAALLLMLVGFSLLMVLYSAMYRVIGPPPLGPLDAPIERRRVRKSR